jgi:hypothetical protein
MKCIKAIKESKYKSGEIIRIGNIEAEEKVMTGYWEFVSKSQWKESMKPKDKSIETSKEINKLLKKNEKREDNVKKTKNLKKNK